MGRTVLWNETDRPKIMGGKLIPPGECREVEDLHLPAGEDHRAGTAQDDAPPPAARDLQANLREVLAGNVKAVIATLADHSSQTLADLAALESQSETPRKTLLAAIAEEQLTRAQAKTGAPV